MNRRENRRAQRREQIRQAATAGAEAKAANPAVAMDAFQNFAARMGYGTSSLAEGTEYQLVRWSNDYWLMLTLYRNHWMIRRLVDTLARDMTRAWPALITDANPLEVAGLSRKMRHCLVPQNINRGLKWSELFGGAGCLMAIKGHEDILDEPLEIDDVDMNSFQGLITFDRWSGIQPGSEIGDDISRPQDFGQPLYYEVHGQGSQTFRVHSSRILRFSGPEVPSPEYEASMRWGISRVEIVFEELRKRDNASWSILQLLFRAQVLAQKNPELAALLSGVGASADAAKHFQQRMQAQNELLSNQSQLILGKDGELQATQYSFSGLDGVMQLFAVDFTGAAEIPYSRFFGRTVTGLAQTGDADERLYEERVQAEQEERERPQLDKLYPVLMRSQWGDYDPNYELNFPTLRPLTEKEKSEMARDGGNLIKDTYVAGIITKQMAMRGLQALGRETGVLDFITDEDVASAPDEFDEGDVDLGGDDDDGEPGGAKAEDAAVAPADAA